MGMDDIDYYQADYDYDRASSWMNDHFGDTLTGDESEEYVQATTILLRIDALDDGHNIPAEAFERVLRDWCDSASSGDDSDDGTWGDL